jgi:hypothetical protein
LLLCVGKAISRFSRIEAVEQNFTNSIDPLGYLNTYTHYRWDRTGGGLTFYGFKVMSVNLALSVCFERLIQVDNIPLKPLLELVEVAHARWKHNESISASLVGSGCGRGQGARSIIRALKALVLPPGAHVVLHGLAGTPCAVAK